MLRIAKMKKVKLFKYTAETTMPIKDGRSFMLTKLTRLQLKDLIKNSVLISTDHFILFLKCQ
jgi:hypothetical protein